MQLYFDVSGEKFVLGCIIRPQLKCFAEGMFSLLKLQMQLVDT